MQVSVETTEGLGRRMTVAVPAEQIESEIKDRLKSLAPKVKISGFRPGKVPFSVVEKRYGIQVRAEVIGDTVSSSFYEAVTKENLRPAGTPKISEQKQTPEQGLEYTAEFEVYPEIKVTGLDSIKLERKVAEINDEDVDDMVEKLRKQRVTWEAVDRAAQTDDQVTVDYKGTINGEVFQGGEGKDLKVIIGAKGMIEGFEDGLIGAEKGKTIELDLKFPESYGSPDIAGKDVHFVLDVSAVEQPVMPEINAEFLKSFNIDGEGIEALKADVRSNMEKEAARLVKSRIKRQVLDAVLEKNNIDVPLALVKEEADRLAQQMQDQLRWQQGQNTDSTGVSSEAYEKEGKRRITLGLILAEIIKENDIRATKEAVRAEVERMAASYGDPQAVVQWYYSDPKRLSEIESLILEEAVVDWVLEQAQVTDTMVPFKDLVSSKE
ncbi:MAG: trigger factor [Gammaproteobacteria bacterium]|nr:trigger factor [Gammaproteobacteria bacterium]